MCTDVRGKASGAQSSQAPQDWGRGVEVGLPTLFWNKNIFKINLGIHLKKIYMIRYR